MAQPRSVQAPPSYLVSTPFRFADPTGLSPDHWRMIAKEPVNRMAQRFVARELCALPFVITSPKENEKRVQSYTDRWEELFENGEGFDVWISRVVDDVCTLPFGAASEVGYKGKELDWILHVDAATLLPTYEQARPYVQVNPDNWIDRVYFTPKQLRRLRANPRTDIRHKQYQTAPTEDAFLAIEALSRIYLYYMQQLADTPPPGILDVMDMTKEEAEEWAGTFRDLLTGVDTIKIPVLYEHTVPAKWIPFARSPQDLNVVEQFKRFAEIVLGKYGLSIGDLRLFEHDATKAGERVSQMVTERSGIGYWASMFEAYLNRILPTGLLFSFKQPRPEKELVVAQRQQTQLAILQAAAGGKALMDVETALLQAGDWELFSVELEAPEPEEAPPSNGGEPDTPTREELEAVEETREVLDDVDLAKKAAVVVMAELGEWQDPPPTVVDQLVQFLAGRFVDAGEGARETSLASILAEARELVSEEAPIEESEQTKAVEPIDTLIEELLDRQVWWQIGLDDEERIEGILQELYRQGFDQTAMEIEMLRLGLTEAPKLVVDWDLRNPRVIELIEDHAAEMVTNVNNGTKFYLRSKLKEAVELGSSTTVAVEAIQSELFGLPTGEASKFTRERIMSIVNYEVNKAMSRAGHELRTQLGLKLKQWFTNRVSPCEICLGNEAQGPVPDNFQYDGVFGAILHPPAHPRTCRCVSTAVESEVRKLSTAPIDWPLTIKALLAKKTSITDAAESRLHQAFTVLFDQLFLLGYIDRDVRIEASGVIGEWLPQISEALKEAILDNAQIRDEDLRALAKSLIATLPKARRPAEKGGPGSGHWGHGGRPGVRGGSAASLARYGSRRPTLSGEKRRKAVESLFNVMGDGDYNYTSVKSRSDLKGWIVEELGDVSGLSDYTVNKAIGQWASSSNDEDMRSLSLQEAASEEFDVPFSEWQQRKVGQAMLNYGQTGLPEGKSLMSRSDERKLLRTMYDNTQAELADLGFKPNDRITLYRGTHLPETAVKTWSQGDIVNVTGNTLESWSLSPDIAEDFGQQWGIVNRGVVFAIDVPVEAVVGTAVSGFGCLTEGELVVLGSTRGQAEVYKFP